MEFFSERQKINRRLNYLEAIAALEGEQIERSLIQDDLEEGTTFRTEWLAELEGQIRQAELEGFRSAYGIQNL